MADANAKEAVVFILDANLTMRAPYPPRDGAAGGDAGPARGDFDFDGEPGAPRGSSRLSRAKDAALAVVVDNMWRSKAHEAGVVVLKAGRTHHHLSEIESVVDAADVGALFALSECGGGGGGPDRCDDGDDGGVPFPNLVEFDLGPPTPHTLRAIDRVRCTIDASTAPTVRGDLCDGLVLAADALHRRTKGRKYKRRIVLITDAEHEVRVDEAQMLRVMDGLNDMEAQLVVVGIGFEEGVGESADDEDSHDDDASEEDADVKPDAVVSEAAIKEEGNPDEMTTAAKREEEGDVDAERLMKSENQKLLLSIARETNGCILAANGIDLTELLRTKLPRLAGTKRSMRKKYEFRVAPGLTIKARGAKLADPHTLPYTTKEAYQYDPETGEKLRDGGGELMTSPTVKVTEHFDDEDNIVPYDKRTDAYRYGSDLIPVGKMDLLGINAAFAGPESIEMIGYLDRSAVTHSNLLMGPAYAITGGESRKSRAAVAALSRALEETRRVGFCRLVRTRNGDPQIGALLPERDGRGDARGEEGGRYYLAFLQLPFADDLQRHLDRPVPLEAHGDYADERVCDELIDAMMLPDDELRSEDVSSPALRAHQRMISHFAMHPLGPEEEMQEEGLSEGRVLEASRAKPLCEFDAAKRLSKKAADKIDAFVENFPLVEHRPEDDKKERYWGDGI